ncbi:hypothetical protein A2Z33_00500 [Candidatus Gottesmanbacteria bacterium RBG_16_52_11]|uniref:Peptidase S9 prolyl oligopeptidase catalytic domain-containing protein n=1 Tax=Candidatus Gottesmanbacteria bacterium RBG_16_52_11 TaxID=1798374 RepID=A0A1F5YMY5_9BACT|nr:MAG: hypothetical protein A2Z33_00500 [Candidatus Gottesmanbacteria bacterium RBG_16_52_11]
MPYPVTLWAPVTKPFPYSVLYYTDDAPDGGRYLRRELARLETIQDAGALSFTGYLDRLSGPLILHQGSEDDAVPQRWNDDFVFKLKEMDKDIKYYVYPGADHNMNGAWDTVVTRDLEFFRSFHK